MKSTKILAIIILPILLLTLSCSRPTQKKGAAIIPYFYANSGIKAYENGNIQLGVKMIEKNCSNHSYEDCNYIATFYEKGIYGYPQSDKDALSTLMKSCNNNSSVACVRVSEYFRIDHNKDAESYYKKAINIMDSACKKENIEECKRLAIEYLEGRLNNPSDNHIPYLSLACSKEDGEACNILGNFYLNSKGDEPLAITYFNKSCELRDTNGCINLINIYMRTKYISAKTISSTLLKTEDLCYGGATYMCTFLGDMYKKYTPISKIDNEKSFKLFDVACSYTNPYACKLVGDAYSKGIGTKQNKDLATYFYKTACSLGHELACNLK